MTAISDGLLLAEVTGSTATLAALIDGADLTQQVPTCPEWTLQQLTTHVGRAHRWAAENIRLKSSEPIPFRQAPGGRLPDDPAEHPGWLAEGAAMLASEVRTAGPDVMWTPGGMNTVRGWARRMAHETAVHRADAQITFGQSPEIDPAVATDGVDEWFELLAFPRPGTPYAEVLAGGRVLHLHATDSGGAPAGEDGTPAGADGASGEWLVTGAPEGIAVTSGHGKGDVAVRGPAAALMLLLVRRLPPDSPQLQVIGDRGLLDAWLASTPY
jgi:uncharacterized protein (TIGR03083 family)